MAADPSAPIHVIHAARAHVERPVLARDLVDAFGVPEEMLRSPALVG